MIQENKSNLLRSLDLFGVPIQINFNYNNKHKTKFGGFISLIILGVIISIIVNSLYQIILKQNPQIYQESLIQIPKRTDLSRKNFIFAFGILDEKFDPFMDETIYKPYAYFMYKVPKKDDSGETVYQLTSQDISIGPCTKDLFGVEGLQDYFTQINKYQQLYCIQNIDDLYLEGQFESSNFSTIEIYIKPCLGQGCADPEIVRNKLKAQQLQIYFSNYIVKASDFENPFQPFGQSTYFNVNMNNLQALSFNFKNYYVNDDVGLITSQIRQQKGLVFSKQSQLIATDTTNGIFQLSIYLEKNQEYNVNRTYTKLIYAFSQIGGIYNVLFFIGCVFAQPYSSLELKRKLVNSTFSFPISSENQNEHSQNSLIKDTDSVNKENKQLNQQSNQFNQDVTKKKMKKKNGSLSNRNKTPNNLDNQNFKLQDDILKQQNQEVISPYVQTARQSQRLSLVSNNTLSLSKVQQNHISAYQNQSKPFVQTEFHVESPSPKKQANKDSSPQNSQIKNFIINNFNDSFGKVKELTIKSREYFFNYFKCLKSTTLQNVLRFGTDKIAEFTDITFIMNKLLELEKLKHLLLNEDQIKLFEYIPKPKISQSVIEIHKNYTQKRTQKKNKNNSKTKNQQINNQNVEEDLNDEIQKEFNILNIVKRSDEDKAIQAQYAYFQIYKNSKKQSKTDLRLLQLLNQDVISSLDKSQESPIHYTNNINSNYNQKNLRFQNIGSRPFAKLSLISDSNLRETPMSDKFNINFDTKNENFTDVMLEEIKNPPSKTFKLDRYALENGLNKKELFQFSGIEQK